MGINFGYLKDFKYRFPNRKLYSLMDKVFDLKTLKEVFRHLDIFVRRRFRIYIEKH